MKRKSVIKIIDYLSIVVIVCLPTLLWTFNHIDRYVRWLSFYIILIGLGVILGLTIFKIVSRNNIELKKHKTKKGVSLLHTIIAISIMLTPLFGITINENIDVTTEVKSYRIDRIGQSGGSHKANYIFILNDANKIMRLQFGKAFVNKYSNQETVVLNYNIGFLGFAYYSIPKKTN